MMFRLSTLSDLADASFDTIIDVRSPSEFADDHVPGAINLPVLSDEERARVGTIYKQESPFLARKIGAALVARNAAHHIETALADRDGGWRPLVYCWRGGQRSGSFASILAQIGWRAEVVEGGYRTYRRLVSSRLYETPFPAPVVLLDGDTGTGKTAILTRLASRGVQVIDLEGLANHRGSALGGQGPQPGQKAFESRLAMAIQSLDPARPVVIEAESSRVGRLNLPPGLFTAMKAAPRVDIEAPVGARADYLVQTYRDADQDRAGFSAKLDRLRGLQGHARVDSWQAMLADGRLRDLAAELVELHYDPRYAKVRARRTGDAIATITVPVLDEQGLDAAADQVARVVSESQPARRTTLSSGR